ncbi:salicylate hydroxylase [Podospora didyma]|uniref:Salicylate hydroxylase n=1 Tax=Podospora didyma TaxID=330526 RepID=A0AAE0U3J5_9PEZI|nr:salicylate hydroxylase [Podospora didyma]
MAENVLIRIAVIGGGVAGATVANALFQLGNMDVFMYESASEFSERGAAVGLAGQAQLALQQAIPLAQELLRKAGAVPMNSSHLLLGSGPAAGTVIVDLEDDGSCEVIVHRASLLRELLAPFPQERLHASKKLIDITVMEDESLEIRFEDGTSDRFDAVVGADGIFSSVRNHVLGDAAAEHVPTPAGFWDCRVLVPFDKASSTLGKKHFEVDRQYGWIGDGAFIMHDILENRTTIQCIISGVEKDPPKNRKRPLTREFLTDILGTWLDGPIAKGAIDLVLDQPDPQGYSQWEHKSTPTYANGRVCIVGDAAHATSPWQGAGAGQAFEDAVVLGTLLGKITRPQDIGAAFKAFDTVRRPRCQRIIDSSRDTGEVLCGVKKAVALDPGKLLGALVDRWTFILTFDLEEHKREALEKMEEFKMSLE